MVRMLVLTVTLSLLTGCATSPPEEYMKPAVAEPDSRGLQTMQIRAANYYFDPSHVVVRAGQPVELTLTRAPGVVPHDFLLLAEQADAKVHVELTPEPKVVRFTPTRPGRYTYICTKRFLGSSHRERGMEGVLEVVAPER